MPTTGLVIGKFMPVHAGHRYLIDRARAQVDHLTVVVCSIAREPIPGELRYAWMQALYPDLTVVHLAEELPQEPHEHPDFWHLWTAALRRCHPAPIDVVCASEEYVYRLAACLGARPVLIDLARTAVPISGTAVRRDPFAYWDAIPELVRPYFVKKVCILGAESTGKTTLAANLAAHYGTIWAPEYGRVYVDTHLRALEDLTLADIEAIATGHLSQERALIERAHKLLICDTDLVTTVIYSEVYFGVCASWIVEQSYAQRYDLYLLMLPDVPWVADAQRDLPHLRAAIHARFVHELAQRGFPYVAIGGAWNDRFAQAVGAIDALLHASPTGLSCD